MNRTNRDLPKNITKRKDGRYCYRYQVDGKTKSVYSWNLDDLILLKKEHYIGDTKGANSFIFEKVVDRNLKTNLCKMETAISKIFQEDQFVYFITDGEFVKIGVSQNVSKRLSQMQIGNARRLKVLTCVQTHAPYLIENALHVLLEERRVCGEWYDILDLFNERENGNFY